MLGLRRAQLLIIATDDPFRHKLARRLRLEEYVVFETGREDEATRILRRSGIDVVLLGVSGNAQQSLGLLKQVKRLRPLTEVILLTPEEAHSLPVSLEGMRSGAFDELLIPFDVETLIERVREACQRKKHNEQRRKAPEAPRSEKTE